MGLDLPYLFFIVALFILALLEINYVVLSKVFFTIATAVVFFFLAFRAPVICGDMWDYTKDAIGKTSMYTYGIENLEPLYVAYRSFFRYLCPYIFPYILITTLIIFLPIWVLIKRYSKYKTVSILAFFLLIEFWIFLCAIRQCMALSFLLWGVMYVYEDKKRKWYVFALLSVIAFFFHHSSLFVTALFVGSYFMPLKSRKIALSVIFVSFLIGMIFRSFDIFSFLRIVSQWGIVDDKYVSTYLDEDAKYNQESTGVIGLTVISRPILAMIIFYFIDKNKVDHWFSKIYFVGIVLLNLFPTLALISRMVISNMLFVIIVFQWLLTSKAYFTKKLHLIVKYAVVGIFLVYSLSYYKQYGKMGPRYNAVRTHPYCFIWEDYSRHPSIYYH